MKSRVIVDPHFRKMGEIFSPLDRRRLDDRVDVIWGQDEPMPTARFLQALPQADVVVCADWRYGDVLAQAKRLKAIMTVSGAFPLKLDYEGCWRQGIRVLSAAPAFAEMVAEFSLGLALAAAREIPLGDRAMRRGDERYLHDGNRQAFMLYGQDVGLIGYGSIARALQALLKPFRARLLAYDPWLGEGYLRRQGVEPAPLEKLMSVSRFIFVLAAPTVENRAMLSREYLEMIQDGAVLILASRAHVVDFDAMTEMVLAGRYKAAVDVFPTEPLEADHPIRGAEAAVLSAHRAGTVREGLFELGRMVVDDLEAVTQGLPPRCLQNAEPELSRRYASSKAKPGNNA